ncbi:hypothetical protein SAMN04488498_13129 [Mesorhizobium albiziae]|uniref:Uncharacterized protein n=1 Tax=Neomesorhizobium albiziae TaxID=335020 RepID=A0A1I4F0F2_9HYPH|nr:hypothetical protein [Mesorhizobium albiziae]SFL09871.1 hypothetical protein SAMN04488498_13129 [Mesorhizobium albiziae]
MLASEDESLQISAKVGGCIREALETEIAGHRAIKKDLLSAFGVMSLPEVVERDELLGERERLRVTLVELEEQLSTELAMDGVTQTRLLLEDSRTCVVRA